MVNLGAPPAGLSSLQEVWANVVVRLAIDHPMERPSPYPGHHCRVVIDECQIVAPVLSDTAERVLTTGRSRGVSLVVLSQGTTLLQEASSTLLRVLLTNRPTKIVGRLAVADAELLAREQAPRPGIDESLSALRGRFASRLCNLSDRELFLLTPGARVGFRSATVDLDAWRRSQDPRRLETVKRRHALPPDQPPRATLPELPPRPRRHPRQSTPPGPCCGSTK